MNFISDYTVENFIRNACWEGFPSEVKDKAKGCFLDLMGALIIGSRSRQFEAGEKLAEEAFGIGDIPAVGSKKKFSFLGAACAMGHSSNAYDIDDGHNLIRAHPGAAVVGALLAAAWEKGISIKEFLVALTVSYEVTIRMGAAIMDYYNFAHSSGTFGAPGVAAGLGKIYDFSIEELNNVLSVAEFNAPLVPGIRSVEYPSMNKDGVPFGVMVGALAVKASMAGFKGNKHLLEAEQYGHYAYDLGKRWQIMDLYFKPYTCCRWAHPAIDAVLNLMRTNGITHREIERIVIETFEKASMLSKIRPETADEAQYNIAYPVAAAAVHGDFGLAQCRDENLKDEAVLGMMEVLEFKVDDDLDRQFPARRLCRARISLKDGRVLVSPECEPRGEAKENIGWNWLEGKFRRISGAVFTAEGQDNLIAMIQDECGASVRDLMAAVNDRRYWKD